MSKLIFLAVAALFATLPAGSQTVADCPPDAPAATRSVPRHPRFRPEEIQKQYAEFITREAQLTPQEAQAVLPILTEMKRTQRDLRGKFHRACRRADDAKLTDADAKNIVKEVGRLQKQLANTEQDAFERVGKAVGARKQLAVMNADLQFGRRMFHNLTQGRPAPADKPQGQPRRKPHRR